MGIESSWLLRDHLSAGGWRPSPGQSDVDQIGQTVPHRFRLHLGPRSQAAAAAHEAQQGDVRGHGRGPLGALPAVPQALLHHLPPSQKVIFFHQ